MLHVTFCGINIVLSRNYSRQKCSRVIFKRQIENVLLVTKLYLKPIIEANRKDFHSLNENKFQYF